MKNNIYFLISLFLLLLLLFFPLSIQAISDLSPECNNEIASTVNDASYPNGCRVSSRNQNPTCCSSKEFNGLSIVSFMDSSGFEVRTGWVVLCPQKTVRFDSVYSGANCDAEINTICGHVNTTNNEGITCSLPQSSACCATTTNFPFPTPTPTISSSSGGTDTTSIPPSTSEEEAIQAVQDNIQNAASLDNQALQKIDEGDYPSVPPIIDNAVESLTDARDSLKTDPDLEQLREDEFSALSIIDRSLQSSINNHKKVSSTIDRIVNAPKVDEGLLSKLLKKAKKFLSDLIKRELRTGHAVGVVAATRG